MPGEGGQAGGVPLLGAEHAIEGAKKNLGFVCGVCGEPLPCLEPAGWEYVRIAAEVVPGPEGSNMAGVQVERSIICTRAECHEEAQKAAAEATFYRPIAEARRWLVNTNEQVAEATG